MQDYQYDNTQASGNFSFQADQIEQKKENTGKAIYAGSKTGYNYSNVPRTQSSAAHAFKQVVGSALMSFGVVVFIFLTGVIITQNIKQAEIDKQYEGAVTSISTMKESHAFYNELDDLFEAGEYDAMYDQYINTYSDVSYYAYSKENFLSLLDSYNEANTWYEEYTTGDRDASYIYAAYLYYNLDFITSQSHYSYEMLDPESREIIDEKIAEVKERAMETLEMNEEELDEFIKSFKDEDSNYLNYSDISEYARTLYGE